MSELDELEKSFKHGEINADELHEKSDSTPSVFLVVTYDREGLPASRYGDDVWDMSAYQKNKPRDTLNFTAWIEDIPTEKHIAITTDMKWLLFLYWHNSGSTPAVSTLRLTLSALRDMATYCYKHETTPIDLLSNPIEFATYLDGAQASVKKIKVLLTALINMGETKRRFPLFLGSNLEIIRQLSQSQYDASKQHPTIPTRIYSALISSATYELDKYEEIVDSYLQLINDCSLDPQLGRGHQQQQTAKKENDLEFSYRPTLPELLVQYGLQSYADAYTKRTGKEIRTIKSLLSHLTRMQSICSLLTTLFTGMRRGETNRLPYDCVEIIYENDRKHYRICGETFKLSGGIAKRTKWVTDPTAVRAIRVAQKISETIYSTIGESLNSEQRESSDYPLFIGTGYLPYSGKRDRIPKKAPYSNAKGLGNKETLPEHLFLMITDEDIQELESIDPFREWRTEKKFFVGSRWHYTSHQARRSLAVYASASGMVSLQSLRRQLQHITKEMTIYYAKGSAFAVNFAADEKDHFYHDFQATQPVAQALLYIAQVLMCDEPIYGGHGKWINQQINQNKTISVEDRQKTMHRFKNGELAFQVTPIGGCTTVEPCEKRAMRTVSACLPCPKSVIKLSKLDKVIEITKVQISRLDPESMEAKLKENDLSEFIIYQDRIKARTK